MATTLSEYELEAPELGEIHETHEAGELGELGELESEWETSEAGMESEANPIRRVYPDAVMEHLGHAATEAESEAEAEAFIGALVPLAAQIAPRIAPTIMRAAPRLLRGASRITRALRRNPRTRQLVRAMPSILRRTVASVARQRAQGQPVTPQTATRALVNQTRQVLTNPRIRARVVRRSRVLDRRYHVAPGAVTTSVRVVNRLWPSCTCCGAPIPSSGPGVARRAF